MDKINCRWEKIMSMFPILDTNLCVWQVSVWSRNYCDIFNIGLFTPELTSGTHWQKTFKIKMVKFLRKIYKCEYIFPRSLCYSCNSITATLIQISTFFYFGFFSKTNHQMIINIKPKKFKNMLQIHNYRHFKFWQTISWKLTYF